MNGKLKNKKLILATHNEGKIKEFTGISDPYEKPINAEIIINSSDEKPEELVNQIYTKIVDMGYISKVKGKES